MKTLRMALAVLALAFVVACGNVPTSTFNDKAAIADNSVQLVQTTSTALLRAGKFTVAQDQAMQAKVQLAHDSIVLAKKMQATDPAAADAKLSATQADLNQMKKETGVAQ